MADKNALDPNAPAPSAEDLRMTVLEAQMKEIEKREKAKDAARKELDDFTASFLGEHVNEKELTMIRRLVMNAVKDGKFEALVYSFPSDLCTDSGRAINNGDPRWPDTLRGKARELYDRFMMNAKPKGYRLKAMVINFPGGMPGDIGFFVNWAPEHI